MSLVLANTFHTHSHLADQQLGKFGTQYLGAAKIQVLRLLNTLNVYTITRGLSTMNGLNFLSAEKHIQLHYHLTQDNKKYFKC